MIWRVSYFDTYHEISPRPKDQTDPAIFTPALVTSPAISKPNFAAPSTVFTANPTTLDITDGSSNATNFMKFKFFIQLLPFKSGKHTEVVG